MSPNAGGRAAPVDVEGPLNVVQVVRSDAFAGVERYVSQVSATLATRGHRVSVIGGDPTRMPRRTTGPGSPPARPDGGRCGGGIAASTARRHRPCPHDRSRDGRLAGAPRTGGAHRRHPALRSRPGDRCAGTAARGLVRTVRHTGPRDQPVRGRPRRRTHRAVGERRRRVSAGSARLPDRGHAAAALAGETVRRRAGSLGVERPSDRAAGGWW